MRPISQKTLRYIQQILDLLRNVDQLHIRGIARFIGCHHVTVSRILDKYLDNVIDVREIDQFGIRAKLISLKPDKRATTLEDIIHYIETKRRIRG
jgi:hypothetical protein